MGHFRTQEILAKFPAAEIIEISHYKDIFCRSRQCIRLQHGSQKLVLAKKEGALLYEGSPVCQDFGNSNFYYASCVMNCIYDCEYCYLKGMYPCANLVIFVNLEDFFKEAGRLLQSRQLYLCISYDTDLLAVEHITGYVSQWAEFAAGYIGRLSVEIRTKCANLQYFRKARPDSDAIYAFTLSPQAVIQAFEHHTPSLDKRIRCAAEALRMGLRVRLCFDPMVYVKDWETHYAEMLEEVSRSIDFGKLMDASVGTFRISQDYLKRMRRQMPGSAAVWFPYEKENGFYHYPAPLMRQMEQFLAGKLSEKMGEGKVFLWKE